MCYNGVGDDMRLRNVPGANEKILSSPYMILNYQDYRGKYHTLFQNQHPIHLEIGMGKGAFLIEKAKRYPDINFIGIEKYDSVIVRALEKVEEENLPNLRFIRMDAEKIEEAFWHEIDTIYLNFSDPWPKNRHEHRRLTSAYFLKKYDSLFTENPKIIMKTDNRHLFEFSIKSFVDAGYSIENICLNVYEEGLAFNIPTEYETKFHTLGFPIYQIEVKKECRKERKG